MIRMLESVRKGPGLDTVVLPPTKRINVRTRQSGLWDCKQKNEKTNSVSSNEERPAQFRKNTETVRQEGSDSVLIYETVREDRTRPYTMRPSEVFIGGCCVVARQPLSLRDL